MLRISDDLSKLAAQQGHLHAQSEACVAAVADDASQSTLGLNPLTTTNCFLQARLILPSLLIHGNCTRLGCKS